MAGRTFNCRYTAKTFRATRLFDYLKTTHHRRRSKRWPIETGVGASPLEQTPDLKHHLQISRCLVPHFIHRTFRQFTHMRIHTKSMTVDFSNGTVHLHKPRLTSDPAIRAIYCSNLIPHPQASTLNVNNRSSTIRLRHD